MFFPKWTWTAWETTKSTKLPYFERKLLSPNHLVFLLIHLRFLRFLGEFFPPLQSRFLDGWRMIDRIAGSCYSKWGGISSQLALLTGGIDDIIETRNFFALPWLSNRFLLTAAVPSLCFQTREVFSWNFLSFACWTEYESHMKACGKTLSRWRRKMLISIWLDASNAFKLR